MNFSYPIIWNISSHRVQLQEDLVPLFLLLDFAQVGAAFAQDYVPEILSSLVVLNYHGRHYWLEMSRFMAQQPMVQHRPMDTAILLILGYAW